MSSIFASAVLGVFVGLILILIYETFIYFRDKYKSYKVYKHSDKRTFDRLEVVWFNKHKFYIESYTKWSHNLDIDLTLRHVEYNLSILDTKVDSREVKKVVRMYAQLGESEYKYYSTDKGVEFEGVNGSVDLAFSNSRWQTNYTSNC